MNREQIWAPWRLAYIKSNAEKSEATDSGDSVATPENLSLLAGGDENCFLCRAVVTQGQRENFVLRVQEHTVTVLNRYPYNNGHLLVAPKRHKGKLYQLNDAEHLQCMQEVTQLIRTLEELLEAQGFNVGLNLGHIAGAGLPGHLHWHIVPRWSGDTNFMSVLSGVDVIPQSLDALWSALREMLQKVD